MTNKTWQKWSIEEDDKLKLYWSDSTMNELLEAFPNRKYNSLMCRAVYLKLKNLNSRSRVNGDLSILLEKNPLSFYLLGFILADGCFTSKNDLSISQSVNEKDFFYNFVKHLNCDISKIKTRTVQSNSYTKNPFTSVYFRIGHKQILDKLKNLLQLDLNKTYNPPKNIEYFFVEELLPFFLIGLIDGDGCIWNNGTPQIRIEMHKSWFDILDKIKNQINVLYGMNLKTKMSKRGYAQLWFGSIHSIYWIYNIAKSVFHMESKWLKIDDYIQNKYIPKYINTPNHKV